MSLHITIPTISMSGRTAIDYFAKIDFTINKIFSQTVNDGKRPFPKDEAEFKKILKRKQFGFFRNQRRLRRIRFILLLTKDHVMQTNKL